MSTTVTKRMMKNTSWLLGGTVISGVINFFVIIYLARILGAAAFGLFFFVQAFLSYLILFVDSGISMLGVKEIASNMNKAGSIIINIVMIRFVLAVIIYLISVVAVLLLPIQSDIRILFFITLSVIFYRALSTDWIFQGLEKMEYITLSKLCYSLPYLFVIVYLIKKPDDLLKVPTIQMLFGVLVSIIFLIIIYKKLFLFKIATVDILSWRKYLFAAVPLSAAMLLNQVYSNLDSIMLGIMKSTSVVGYYNASYHVFNVMINVFFIWQSTALPVVSGLITKDLAKAKVFLDKYIRLTLLIAIPVAVVVNITAPLIINVVFGNNYNDAIVSLMILVWTLIPLVIGSIYGITIMIPTGQYNKLYIAAGLGAIVNILLNIILIPSLSYVGAAYATIFAYVIVAITLISFSKNILPFKYADYLLKPVCFSVVGFILAKTSFVIIRPFNQLFYISFAGIVFIVSYITAVALFDRDFIYEFAKEILRRE